MIYGMDKAEGYCTLGFVYFPGRIIIQDLSLGVFFRFFTQGLARQIKSSGFLTFKQFFNQ